MKQDTKAIILLTIYILIALSLSFVGCNFIPALAPADFAYHPPQPVVVDTCTDWTEITEPKFVTAYFTYDDPPFTDKLVQVGPYEAWIYPDNADSIGVKIDSFLKAWKPQYTYHVFVNPSDNQQIAIICEGTNNEMEFRPYMRIKFNGLTSGFGWHRQGFTFIKAVSYEQYSEMADLYPSVDYFTFIGSNYDSLEYIDLSLKILGQCKTGRHTADFRYMPIVMPDSIITLFEDAGWENILQ